MSCNKAFLCVYKQSKLSYKSSTGDWIHDNQQIDDHYIDRETDEKAEEDGDIVINQQDIADYLNLGKNEDVNIEDDDDSDVDLDAAIITQTLSASELRLKRKQRMNEVKLEIANMGESILTDPYKNVVLLDVLCNLLQDEDVQICQLAMLSITRAIIDIMPPYRIGTIDQNIAVKFCYMKFMEFSLLGVYDETNFRSHYPSSCEP